VQGKTVKGWLWLLGRESGRLGWQGLDLLCPPRCVFCRTDVADSPPGSAVVCDGCRGRLSIDQARCLACGSPAVAGDCRRCRRRRSPDWDGIAVLGGYADDLRDLVLAAKRPGSEPITAGLARLLVDRHRGCLASWGLEVVAPVPMHWTRRLARGISAADGLARGVAAGLGLPCRRLLSRVRSTRMQNELAPELRRANVQAAFRGSRGAAGRRILVVDDVTTTGGTLAACRATLLAAGAEAVYVAAVARADAAEPPER
jgi:ComF family protein